MKGLTTFWKYFLVSSLLILTPLSCNKDSGVVNKDSDGDYYISPGPMTKEDSIVQLAIDLDIPFDEKRDNINDIMDKILITKKYLITRLDSLDDRADQMEKMAYEYRRKEDLAVKKKLLEEISHIKKELERIKTLAGDAIKEDSTSIPEVKVPETTSSFENLPPGNYITRLDKYHTISIFISPNGNITFGQKKLDSTTVIKGDKKISPRLQKELEAIRKKLND